MKVWTEFEIEGKVFSLKKPTRRDKEEAEMEHAGRIGECVSRGILTKSMMLKKYEEHGGVLSKEETKEILLARRKLIEAQNLYTKLEIKPKQSAADKKKVLKLREDMTALFSEIQNIETVYEEVFQHTAENIARDFISVWWLINSLYRKSGDDWVKVFDKETFDENVDVYDSYLEEEDKDPIGTKAVTKGITLIVLWVTSKIFSEEDFEDVSKALDEDQAA